MSFDPETVYGVCLHLSAVQAESSMKQEDLGWGGGGSWAQNLSAPTPLSSSLDPGGHPPTAPLLCGQPASAQYLPHGRGHRGLLSASGQW